MVEAPIEEDGQGEPIDDLTDGSWSAVSGCLVPNSPIATLTWTLLGAPSHDVGDDLTSTSEFDELVESDFDEENDESQDNEELEPDELFEASLSNLSFEAGNDAAVQKIDAVRVLDSVDMPATDVVRVTPSAGPTPTTYKGSVRVSTGSVPAVGPPPTPTATKSTTGVLPRIPPPVPKQATGSVASVESTPPQQVRNGHQLPVELPPSPNVAPSVQTAPPVSVVPPVPVSPAMAAPPVQTASSAPVVPPVPSAPSVPSLVANTSNQHFQQRRADDLDALVQELISAEANPVNGRGTPEIRTSRHNWFAEIFDESWLRILPDNTSRRTAREVQFVLDSLRMAPGASVLDMACGYGRHALELSARGFRVTGVDLSRVFLERAHREAQRRNLSPRFMVGDMRDVAFDSEFDAAICLNTSFGFFDDVTNYGIVSSIYRALRPGGQFILETINRDYIAANVPRRRWWDNAELIIMEEVDFDARTSRLNSLRTLVNDKQRPWEQHISIRLYGAHELCGMLAMAGFEIAELSGDVAHRGSYLGAVNRSVIITARKPV